MNVQLSSVCGHVRRACRYQRRAAAFTLVEMLVAMAITLILITALAQAYAVLGQALAEGRAAIEMAGSLRFVAHRLQDDLDRATATMRPGSWQVTGTGYFEIIDGRRVDSSFANTDRSMFGDIDDVLAFTARRDDAPFIGEYNYQPLTSELAEIFWWIQNDSGSDSLDEPFAIYRRILLILPNIDIGLGTGVLARREYPLTEAQSSGFQAGYNFVRDELRDRFRTTDLSIRAHWEPRRRSDGSWVMEFSIRANSLADLTDRRNRFLHWKIPRNRGEDDNARQAGAPYGFPFVLETATGDFPLYGSRKIGEQFGDDLMLWNALGFDVEVFDPSATTRSRQLSADHVEAMTPSDPGYPLFSDFSINPRLRRGRGVFVDLGYGHRESPGDETPGPSLFYGPPVYRQVGTLQSILPNYTYCTWRREYEQFSNVDPSFAYGGIRSAPRPPYPHALRGVQVRLRAWEPDYRQVRQKTVVSHFLME